MSSEATIAPTRYRWWTARSRGSSEGADLRRIPGLCRRADVRPGARLLRLGARRRQRRAAVAKRRLDLPALESARAGRTRGRRDTGWPRRVRCRHGHDTLDVADRRRDRAVGGRSGRHRRCRERRRRHPCHRRGHGRRALVASRSPPERSRRRSSGMGCSTRRHRPPRATRCSRWMCRPASSAGRSDPRQAWASARRPWTLTPPTSARSAVRPTRSRPLEGRCSGPTTTRPYRWPPSPSQVTISSPARRTSASSRIDRLTGSTHWSIAIGGLADAGTAVGQRPHRGGDQHR